MAIDLWWYEKRRQWCVDVPTAEGRKRLYLGVNEKKARAELHRYMARYYEQLEEPPADSIPHLRSDSGALSLVNLAVRFLVWNKANRAPGTWRGYRDGLKHLTRRKKDKLAEELTPSDVEEAKTEMIKAGYAARTINIMVTTVKRMYNWAAKQGLIETNPIGGVEHVNKYVNAPRHPGPKHMELDRALVCIRICSASRPLGDLSELLLLTGMRVGEAVSLTWGDVDFGQKMLTLERHKTSGRSGSRPRQVPLCDRALEIIRAQARNEVDPGRSVFIGRDGQQLTVGGLHCRLRRLREDHSELKHFSFHKLRHTTATYLARLKVPERVAQAILGHSSTLMTRYYTATDPDEMIAAVETLSRQAAGAGPT